MLSGPIAVDGAMRPASTIQKTRHAATLHLDDLLLGREANPAPKVEPGAAEKAILSGQSVGVPIPLKVEIQLLLTGLGDLSPTIQSWVYTEVARSVRLSTILALI